MNKKTHTGGPGRVAPHARRKRDRDLFLTLPWLAAAVACLLALWAVATYAWVVAHRIRFPYDLEWMESGMLCHALRLFQGQPIYAPPSVDFVPHLYTPLYPLVVAGLGHVLGDVGYGLGRSVSLASFVGALAVATWWARREGGSWLAAAIALALPVACFAETGGFYDLARSDSLQLFLTVLGAAVAFYARGRHADMVMAAVLLVAAFFAKQTAAPLIAFVGVGLLPSRRPSVLTLAVAGCGLFALCLWASNRASGGWFWTYIFRLHQSHPFHSHRAYIETPRVLLGLLGAGAVLVPWAVLSFGLRRAADAGRPELDALSSDSQPIPQQVTPSANGLLFLSWLAIGGLLTSMIGFGTQWAHVNAYIPGIFFPALAMAVAAGRLLHRSDEPRAQTQSSRRGRALRQTLVWALLAASLYPRMRALQPRAHVPTDTDRAAGAAVIEKLRSTPGDVLIPFHPFYAHLAGKKTFLHRMGVWDVRDTVAGPVRGLQAAIVQQRFSRIVMDDKVEATWHDWPELLSHYRIVERFVGPRCVEGARTVPSLVLEPVPQQDFVGGPEGPPDDSVF